MGGINQSAIIPKKAGLLLNQLCNRRIMNYYFFVPGITEMKFPKENHHLLRLIMPIRLNVGCADAIDCDIQHFIVQCSGTGNI